MRMGGYPAKPRSLAFLGAGALLATSGAPGVVVWPFGGANGPMGREAAGVRGVKLSEEQRVNALIVVDKGYILTASENGYGKLTPIEDFPTHGRGGQGVIALQLTERNGAMIGALQVTADDEIMLMSQAGVLVRTPVSNISIVGRNTQGVRLIRLEEGDRLSGLERIDGLARDDVAAEDENPDAPGEAADGGSESGGPA